MVEIEEGRRYIFFCVKRDTCPKYTRGSCPGQQVCDYYITDYIDNKKVLRCGCNRVKCIQENWQKKLNGIKVTPIFIMEPTKEGDVLCLGNKENRHKATLVRHHGDDYIWVCPICFEEFQIIPKEDE